MLLILVGRVELEAFIYPKPTKSITATSAEPQSLARLPQGPRVRQGLIVSAQCPEPAVLAARDVHLSFGWWGAREKGTVEVIVVG